MLRRTALVAAVSAAMGIMACVSDDPIDLHAKNDAGTAGDGGVEAQASSGGDASPNRPGLLCGSLLENRFPSCPGVGSSDDVCKDLTSACCPGTSCVKPGTTCATSAAFECFTGAQCNDTDGAYSRFCCTTGVLDKDTKTMNGCGMADRLTLSATANTQCSTSCTDLQLCKPNDARDTCAKGTCQETAIIVPNPKGEAFIRKVGVCRP